MKQSFFEGREIVSLGQSHDSWLLRYRIKGNCLLDLRRHWQPLRQTLVALSALTLVLLPVALAEAGIPIEFVFLGNGSGTAAPDGSLPEIGLGIGHAETGVGDLETIIPPPFGGTNVGTIIGADRFYSNGITGQGTITANVDSGHIWNGHETLGHVSTFVHDPSAWNDPGTPDSQMSDLFDRHGTWVAMHLGGRMGGANPGGHQTGIAPDTDLRSGAIASRWSGNAYALGFFFNVNTFLTAYGSYFGSADVINSSWGAIDPPGVQGFTLAADGLSFQNPSTTFVVSAGNNSDPDNDPNTPPVTNVVNLLGSGYNAITVGALQNDGSNNYDAVASFSSRGPQDFGYVDPNVGPVGCNACRAAVDITAPGTDLVTAYYGGQTGGNNPTLPGSPNGAAGGPNFYTLGVAGTSFAAPITAGSAALIDSASYNTPALAANPNSRDARVVKAVLQNSADKIPGWDNGQVAHPNGNGGVQTTQSLDYDSGAGAIDMDAAYEQYLNGTTDVTGTASGNQGVVDTVGWDFGVVEDGTDNVYTINQTLQGGSTFTATLAWFRDRALELVPSPLVRENSQADLDLYVLDLLSGDLISESVSFVNVVEHLNFVLPRTSQYQLGVSFAGATFDNIGNLDSAAYGLAWSAVAIPEPTCAILVAIGVLALGGVDGRRRRDV